MATLQYVPNAVPTSSASAATTSVAVAVAVVMQRRCRSRSHPEVKRGKVRSEGIMHDGDDGAQRYRHELDDETTRRGAEKETMKGYGVWLRDNKLQGL